MLRLWRPNGPQSDPRGSPKGGQNLSKIASKSSLSHRGRHLATFDLKTLSQGGYPPQIHRKSAEKYTKFNEILPEYGYSLLLQNSTNKNGGRSALYFLLLGGCFSRQSSGLVDRKNRTTNVCSFTNGNGELHTATQMTPCLTPCKKISRALYCTPGLVHCTCVKAFPAAAE